MKITGTTSRFNTSIYVITKLHISADSVHFNYRLIVAPTEYVRTISLGVHEGTYRLVCS
jgi:hypothetical protein